MASKIILKASLNLIKISDANSKKIKISFLLAEVNVA
jgi:hypothetical protein